MESALFIWLIHSAICAMRVEGNPDFQYLKRGGAQEIFRLGPGASPINLLDVLKSL